MACAEAPGAAEQALLADLPGEFKVRMELLTITVAGDGEFQFTHDGHGLFWGRVIQVSGNFEDGLTRTEVPG